VRGKRRIGNFIVLAAVAFKESGKANNRTRNTIQLFITQLNFLRQFLSGELTAVLCTQSNQ
jgi:hypothetical protein